MNFKGAGSARYNLLSVSNHMGRLGGGHYTASALHTIENRFVHRSKLTVLVLISWFRWFNFNDNFVSPQNPESCISDSAYVLFYVREDQEWMPKWKPSPNNQLKPGELEICAHMYYLGILKSLQLVTFFFKRNHTRMGLALSELEFSIQKGLPMIVRLPVIKSVV